MATLFVFCDVFAVWYILGQIGAWITFYGLNRWYNSSATADINKVLETELEVKTNEITPLLKNFCAKYNTFYKRAVWSLNMALFGPLILFFGLMLSVTVFYLFRYVRS